MNRTKRKNKHGRAGVKRRLARFEQPVTLAEAEARGYSRGRQDGITEGRASAFGEIHGVLDRKLSASNMRKWLQERIGD